MYILNTSSLLDMCIVDILSQASLSSHYFKSVLYRPVFNFREGGGRTEEDRILSRLYTQCRVPHGAHSHNPKIMTL